MKSRWSIVREAPAGVRDVNGGRSRRRVRVRCFCGHEAIVWLEDIEQERSHGCRSRRCLAHFEAAQAVRHAIERWAHGAPGRHPFEALGDPLMAQREEIAAAMADAFDQLFRTRVQQSMQAWEE